MGFDFDKQATGIRLCWSPKPEKLHLYEEVHFERGWAAVETILRRAQVAGSVTVNGEFSEYFCDLMRPDGDFEDVVALDRGSFLHLKNKLRPKRQRSPRD